MHIYTKVTEKYGKYRQKLIYGLKQSTTVTTLIFMKLTFPHHFVYNCTIFHKNSINGVVADTRSAIDGQV